MSQYKFKLGDYVYYPKDNIHGSKYFYIIGICDLSKVRLMNEKAQYELHISPRAIYNEKIRNNIGVSSFYVYESELLKYNHGLNRAIFRTKD